MLLTYVFVPLALRPRIREEMVADIVARQLPVSMKQLRRCLRSLTRSDATLTGSIRYGLDGKPAGVVTDEEYRLSQLRLEKVLKLRE
ncbi:ProQ/FINO family protein [Escherichia coli]